MTRKMGESPRQDAIERQIFSKPVFARVGMSRRGSATWSARCCTVKASRSRFSSGSTTRVSPSRAAPSSAPATKPCRTLYPTSQTSHDEL